MYDAQIGRWHVPDPLTEWNFKFTPYHYCSNDPINRIDPFGLTDGPTNNNTNILPEVVVVAPKLPNINLDPQKQDSWLNNALNWLRYPEGNHNPYLVRPADNYERWLQRNFDQSRVREYGQAYADPFFQFSMLNNYVTDGDYFKGYESSEDTTEETSDKKIKEQTGDKTDRSGKKWSKINGVVTVRKDNLSVGFNNIYGKKGKLGDTVYISISYRTGKELDSTVRKAFGFRYVDVPSYKK